MSPGQLRFWTAMAAFAVIAVVIGLRAYFSSPQKVARPRNQDQLRVPREDAKVAFVGNQQCAPCHAEIAEAYSSSGMSQSWQKVDATTAPPASVTDTVADPHGPYRYHVQYKDDHLDQVETSNDDATHQLIRTASFQVGSGKHAAGYVAEHNGYLTQLPLAWYAHSGHWDLSPGYELHNRRFDRPVLSGCVSCHGGQTESLAPATNLYRLPVISGIACERCHGPGQKHVEYHQDRPTAPKADGFSEVVDATIVNPAHLSADRANDVCLQCHLQGDIVMYRSEADAFSFSPGDDLGDHRVDYLIRTSDEDFFGVAGHGARMLQSRCWTESNGQLTCIHCHDPHHSVAEIPRAVFDAKCLDCHRFDDCSRPGDGPRTANELGCTACHMPQRPTREGLHLVFTDHLISRPSSNPFPERPASSPAPNADIELIDLRNFPDPHQAVLGAAYVKLHESMGPQLPSLERGRRLLQTAYQRDPKNPDTTFWLGSAMLAGRNSAASTALLAPLVDQHPGWHEARFRLAVAYDQARVYPAAITHYERLVRDAPDWLEPYPLLVRLYLFQQNADAAEALLRRQLGHYPDAEAYAALALTTRLQGLPLAESLAWIDKALALDPRHVSALLNRGFLLAEAGRTDAAKRDFQTVLQLEPGHPKATAGLRSLP